LGDDKLKSILGLLLVALSLQSYAGTEGRGIIKENGIQLYRIPKLLPPAGWVVDDSLSQRYQMIALAPSGKSFADSTSVMYAKAIYLPKRKISIDEHIQSDVSDFRDRDPKVTALPSDAVKDQDNNYWKVLDFVYSAGDITNHESVAYLEEGEYIFHLVLSSRSKSDFTAHRPQFVKWVTGYRNLPEATDPNKRNETPKK
jgi:hypothetical protein